MEGGPTCDARPELDGAAGECRHRDQWVCLSLQRAECCAHHVLGQVGGDREQLRAAEQMHLKARLAVDLRFAPDSRHFGSIFGYQETSMGDHLEITSQLLAQGLPQPDGVGQQPDNRRELPCPSFSFQEKLLLRYLGMQTSGICAGSQRTEIMGLDQRDIGAFLGKEIGHRTASQPAAHDQYVGLTKSHPDLRFSSSYVP